MQVAHRDTGTRFGGFEHRPGGIGFTSLLTGESGARDNFEFCLVHANGEYHTPQHQHNFDQVRVILEGEFGYAKDKTQKAGTIGYFCEGTRYVQSGVGTSETLLLQCSGASHSNYLSLGDLKSVTNELATNGEGEFDEGIYTWVDEHGKKHNKDGWQAAWEFKFDQPVVYPKPKFDEPVIMNPDNFNWIPTGVEGVSARHLGSFQERHLRISQLALEAGAAFEVPPSDARRLLFVYEGEGVFGEEPVHRHSAAMLDPRESVTIEAGEALTLLSILLPRYDGPPVF